MSIFARVALLAVVFVDLIGQGLVFPIVNELIMSTHLSFLPLSTSQAERHLYYGLCIGIFFIAWFFGAIYIAKLSDSIGRKKGIVICLFGALIGYLLTILSLFVNSLWLLILGRAISGFTAGNQPIAQAAMIDASNSEQEKARNMGLIVAGISAGLVGGPIIGGVFSDSSLLGHYASLKLPFYVATLLIVVTIFLVQRYYTDTKPPIKGIRIKLSEVFTQLLHIRQKPVVGRLFWAYFAFMIANNAFFIFMTNYMTSRFHIGLFGTNMEMIVLGVAMASASLFLVAPILKRFDKISIVSTVTLIMALSTLGFVLSTHFLYCYVFIAIFYLSFGVAYPAILSLFSGSVSDDEQGWVMGVTTAGFTLAAGLSSFVGGGLMAISLTISFYVTAGFAFLALLLVVFTWRIQPIKQIAKA
ncbi:MFS transporter [Vibrio sp. S4M6]|uniref:MFS transporter n=1 Tax=Vibrio sinus TaxID=2946865 RepID=UPI00202ABA47|nr:MFS transporter [Vibrio sinus]MCL9782457.1 MFS transporter [Vibrio sinus]